MYFNNYYTLNLILNNFNVHGSTTTFDLTLQAFPLTNKQLFTDTESKIKQIGKKRGNKEIIYVTLVIVSINYRAELVSWNNTTEPSFFSDYIQS